jgi:hypothetical protein
VLALPVVFSAMRARAWKDPGRERRGWVRSLLLICVLTGCGRIHYDHVGAADAADPADADGGMDVLDAASLDDADAGETPADAEAATDADLDASDPIDGAPSLDGEAADGTTGDAMARDTGPATGAIDVTDLSRVILVGAAAIGAGGLVLTPEVQGAAGAAYLGVPYPIDAATSFVVSFSSASPARWPGAGMASRCSGTTIRAARRASAVRAVGWATPASRRASSSSSTSSPMPSTHAETRWRSPRTATP